MDLFACLPPELLLLVCGYVDCEDFVNFAMVNRRTYTIALQGLERHQDLWCQYFSFADQACTMLNFWPDVMRSLRDNGEAAADVRKLSIRFLADNQDFRRQAEE